MLSQTAQYADAQGACNQKRSTDDQNLQRNNVYGYGLMDIQRAIRAIP
jgi:hypothetical protein